MGAGRLRPQLISCRQAYPLKTAPIAAFTFRAICSCKKRSFLIKIFFLQCVRYICGYKYCTMSYFGKDITIPDQDVDRVRSLAESLMPVFADHYCRTQERNYPDGQSTQFHEAAAKAAIRQAAVFNMKWNETIQVLDKSVY